MLSVKKTASNCLSLSKPFSVVRDLFGYEFARPNRQMSLKRQLQLIHGPCLDINVIFVRWLEFPQAADIEEVAHAVQIARDIFSQVGLGIRKVRWQQVWSSIHVDIDSKAEAVDVTDDYSSAFDGLDVFIVRDMYGNHVGWSAVDGTCGKYVCLVSRAA